MQLSDVFLQLGEERLRQLVRNISIGKLRTYQLYDRFKTRTHLPKVNTENLRAAAPRFWKRLEARETEFATDLSQAILISHLDMVASVLNFLGIPNQEGFFEKDIDAKPFLTEGWQTRVFENFKGAYNETLLLFYINHLDLELGGAQHAFIPRDGASGIADMQDLLDSALARITASASAEELEAVRVEVLGRKGVLAQLSKDMGKLSPEERVARGKFINAAKQSLEGAYERIRGRFESDALAKRLDCEWLDLTIPAPGPPPGSLHPITQIQWEIEDLFRSLGFSVLDGPEVETEYYNFDALNIPADHPARDMQDTFWLEGHHLLRTHTSPVQVRGMEKLGPPLRLIAPGRVFRNESVDASHEHTFYQLEGMMIDRNVSVGNLIYFMKTLLTAIFQREVVIRLRPGFFPFVEPGFELDIRCLICGGPGCPVCKQSGWVELLPCGLVNPHVLRMSGIDPNEWNGFAFGLGLTRLAMMRYEIDDIRWLQSGDLRFLRQF